MFLRAHDCEQHKGSYIFLCLYTPTISTMDKLLEIGQKSISDDNDNIKQVCNDNSCVERKIGKEKKKEFVCV